LVSSDDNEITAENFGALLDSLMKKANQGHGEERKKNVAMVGSLVIIEPIGLAREMATRWPKCS